MDVCHVLLCRPWQNDVDATHRGRWNIYLFSWFEKKIANLPIGSTVVVKAEGKTKLTMVNSREKFKNETKDTIEAFALVVKGPKAKSNREVPKVIQPILQ